MKPGAQFEQCADFSVNLHVTLGGGQYADDQLEQRGFPGSVFADQTERLACMYAKIDVLQNSGCSDIALPRNRPSNAFMRSRRRVTLGYFFPKSCASTRMRASIRDTYRKSSKWDCRRLNMINPIARASSATISDTKVSTIEIVPEPSRIVRKNSV